MAVPFGKIAFEEGGDRTFDETRKISKYYVSWEEFLGLAESVAEKLDPLKYDIVLGVANGGLSFAQTVYERIRDGNRELSCGSVQLRRYRQEGDGRGVEFFYFPDELLRGKRTLVCDEVADDGITLQALKTRLEEIGCSTEYATVFVKEGSAFNPDYYGRRIPKTVRHNGEAYLNWLVFPWEKEWAEFYLGRRAPAAKRT
ncbi:MAG: phosphoribosyltransferase family protein [archaeon]